MNQRCIATVLLSGLLFVGSVTYGASVEVTGVEFLQKTTITIPMEAQNNAPQAELSADVWFNNGQSEITLTYKKLKPAILYGGDVSAYVLWAITSDGRTANLGQVQQSDKASGSEVFYAGLKGFAMLVTAEPYFMVSRPSAMVMFVGGAPKKDKSRSATYPFYDFARAPKHDVENIDNLNWDSKTSLILLQANKAHELASRYGAPTYAPGQYEMAGSELKAAEEFAEKGPKNKKIDGPARNSVQFSNMAINIALRKSVAEGLAEIIAARRAQLENAEERSEEAEMMLAVLANQQARMSTTLDEVESENIELKSLLVGALSSIAEARIEAATVVLTLPGILFDTDKATLKPEAQMALAKLSGILMVFHKATVTIEGYTDSTGAQRHNLDLSAQRAESVMKLLVEEGLAGGRLSAVGYGDGNPVADNSTEAGRAANRRVELLIVTGEW